MDASDRTQAQAPASGGVRFAPSPTGRFHVGNLRTAWVSLLWARVLGVPWVVRIEDIDHPRVLQGAVELQLGDLAALGLEPDLLLVQSGFHERHWQVFARAIHAGQVYPCDCSRKEVQAALAGLASAPHETPALYSGHCRSRTVRPLQASESLAWRFRMPEASGVEDFIVARSGVSIDTNGLPDPVGFVPAYHWACAIDDYDGRYELLVRSIDLKPAARSQRAIQRWLSAEDKLSESFEPAVFHTSLITQNDGHRLEKRTKGVTLPELAASGITPEKLLRVFEKSFDRSLLAHLHTNLHATTTENEHPHLGALLEERLERITLFELGL